MPNQPASSTILRELKKVFERERADEEIRMSTPEDAHSVIASLTRIVKDLENPFLGQSNSEFFLKKLNSTKNGKLILNQLRKLTFEDLYSSDSYEASVNEFLKKNGRLIMMVKEHSKIIQALYNLSKDEPFKELYDGFIRAKTSEGLSLSPQHSPETKKGMMELIFEKELYALKSKGIEIKNLEYFIKMFDAQMKPKLFDKDKAVAFIEKMFSAIEDLKTTKGTEHSDRKMTSKPESSKGFSK